jgi:hypothetical protein
MRKLLLVLLCSATLAAEDYQISGIVIDHLTKQPVNHALVEITSTGKDGGEASVLTEADGHFKFLHVPMGKYNLTAERRGQQPQGFHEDSGFSTAIVVDGRQKTDNLVFALRSDAAIAGIIMGDDGEPVRGAQVTLFRESVIDGEAQTIQVNNTATSSSGQFHFGHLEAGKYYLAAAGTPWYQSGETVYPVTFYGDTTNADAASSIVLIEGGSANVQINFHAVPGIRVKLASRNHGFGLFVPGPGGTQIPIPTSVGGGSLKRHTATGNVIVNMPQGNETGNIELFNLAAGRYLVTMYPQTGGQGQVTETVDLMDGSVLSLENPASTGTVSGKIIFDSPRPNGDLELFLGSGRHTTVAEVAADGTFKFEKIAPGKFDLHLIPAALIIGSIAVKGARMAHDSLEVAAGADIELTIHAQASESLATVHGFVTHENAGVPGAMVLLLPQDLARVRLMRRDQSDLDGSFALTHVQPGKYTLVAIDDGRDLAYKDENQIKPYLEGGVAVTIPGKSSDPVKVPVQTRKR